MLRVIFGVVHAHHIGRRFGILRRCGKNDLLRAMHKVAGGKLRGIELAGGFHDVFRTAGVPGDVRNIAFTKHSHLMPVDADAIPAFFDFAREPPENGIILHQVDHVIQICLAQIDPTKFNFIRPLRRDAQNRSPDAAKSVDANLDSHACISSRLTYIFNSSGGYPILLKSGL